MYGCRLLIFSSYMYTVSLRLRRAGMGRRYRRKGDGRSSSSSSDDDRRERRKAIKKAHRRAAQLGDAEARRVALPEQLQGRAAGVDLAPAGRPRREPRPLDRLIERS